MNAGIISTIEDRCKRCYSCVRECPAKAIKVVNGQAVVISDRCIQCGHCVKVCSQNAKAIQSDIDKVLYDILPTGNVIAIIAPAFAASFPNHWNKIPTALRNLGFSKVCETAFGADLVSQKYAEYIEQNSDKTIISSPCPAIYNFIEKYYTELVPNLAEIVSPMIAMGKYLKKNFDNDCKVVFIGPCAAKKQEAIDPEVEGCIDAVLTFSELKKIFNLVHIDLEELEDTEFDAPHAFLGKSYPISGGLLKSSNISNDVLAKDILIVEGKQSVVDIINEIDDKKINAKLVDILFCKGCINGPAIESDLNFYSRREKVIDFTLRDIKNVDKNVWKSEIYNNRDLDLRRKFTPENKRRPMPSEEKILEILARTNKITKTDELNCGACGYQTCREYAVAFAKGLAEDDMCLPYLIDKLESANIELESTQEQLQSAEKLASIGQLAAGIAHELNNPLGTIILFSSILKRESKKRCDELNSDEDLSLIIEEANRCKNIVSNLLNFARQGKLKISTFNISKAIETIINTKKIDSSFNDISININDKTSIEIIEGDKDQIKQVLINILNNALESVEESDIKNVNINIKNDDEYVIIDIIDTGCGIDPENIKKLYTPFFTTKKIGKGTGLGLAISYGIIKMHKGHISVKSQKGVGTAFTLKFPLHLASQQIM
ncbi:MAG: GHKL domain-containing protein [Melioribacteraceae bacterium]|nr:GHKL domain-containing protein [Melioribacteraceae bacterium]